MTRSLESLLSRARVLARSLDSPDPDGARRLRGSVVRPLAHLCPPSAADDSTPGDNLWTLTLDATRLQLTPGLPSVLQEATAALQELACREDREARIAELERIQANLAPGIRCQRDGPYLVTNAPLITNWLGEPLPTLPQMALCRCGASSRKPICDGSHADVGFRDDKDPKRVPDRLDTYVGQQVTVLDNRGTCQHSGYCTDRIAMVFHAGEAPFVTPSGGRMDEIVRAVRDCPSGALSYAIDGIEARDQVDHGHSRPAKIEVTKDGPYRITGGIPLSDGDGNEQPRNEGANFEHYALCRCGQSQNKPFCSGMHWSVAFHDPVAEPNDAPTLFEWAGGLPALTRMTRRFYEKYVPADSLLAPLFADMSADHPERVAKWLAEVFCGPDEYSRDHGGYDRMVAQHVGKGLTEEQRARWVELLLKSLEEAGLPGDPEWRSAFRSYIEWGSRLALENSQPGARPPQHMPMPRWDWNTGAGPPGSRLSALAPAGAESEEAPEVMPDPDEPVSYGSHVEGLFRRRDRDSMRFAFDLWAYEDVCQHADAILARLKAGTMPCDGPWPDTKIAVLERWITEGTAP